jgi:uncharacterized metal-binding protein YceD (DUF177 family)
MELRPTEALCVDLELLEPGTHELAVELPKAWVADALSETDAVADRSGIARLELTVQVDRTLLVRGHLELFYTVPCARCLEGAAVDVGAETGELCVTFVPAERLRSWLDLVPRPSGLAGTESGPEADDDIEPLDPAELDEIGYEGSKVDLREFVAEQVLLTYPMRALCSRGEACLGLCMRCGANLNELPRPSKNSPPERCGACGMRLDGLDDEAPESPWKQALAKVKSDN